MTLSRVLVQQQERRLGKPYCRCCGSRRLSDAVDIHFRGQTATNVDLHLYR